MDGPNSERDTGLLQASGAIGVLPHQLSSLERTTIDKIAHDLLQAAGWTGVLCDDFRRAVLGPRFYVTSERWRSKGRTKAAPQQP